MEDSSGDRSETEGLRQRGHLPRTVAARHRAIIRWRDPDVPQELREEAAREIFERLDLWGPEMVAVYTRAEHAWLLGMAAQRSDDLVLVGARGFEPPTS